MAAGQVKTLTGNTVDATGRQDGAVFRTDRHPHYMQSVFDGVVFTGANVMATPVTTQAGLSATTPALTIYNPIASGVYLVLVSVNICCTSSPAAATAFALAWNLSTAAAPSSTTAGTLTSNLIGSTAVGQGACYAIATLPTAPVAFVYLGGPTGASAIGTVTLTRYFDGEYIIAPGVAVSIQSKTAAAILASISWKEVSATN